MVIYVGLLGRAATEAIVSLQAHALIIVKSSYQQSRGWGFRQLALSGEHWGLYLLFDGVEPGGE